jgi:Rieske Fe-S protein
MTTSHPIGAREITRRRFITGLAALTAVAAATATGLIGTPAVADAAPLNLGTRTGTPDGWLTLGPAARLVAGKPKGFPYVRRLKDGWVESRQTGIAYAVKQNGEDVKVFANICTHGGCRVTWNAEKRIFLCPCHAGQFGPDGAVLAGPPSRPLEQLPSRVVDGQVQVFLET